MMEPLCLAELERRLMGGAAAEGARAGDAVPRGEAGEVGGLFHLAIRPLGGVERDPVLLHLAVLVSPL